MFSFLQQLAVIVIGEADVHVAVEPTGIVRRGALLEDDDVNRDGRDDAPDNERGDDDGNEDRDDATGSAW